jgi:hypothetical protein
MKSLKFAKQHTSEIVFLILIAVFFCVYFIHYRTPNRDYWYGEMIRQIVNMLDKITNYQGY